jgi:hypothetical protein
MNLNRSLGRILAFSSRRSGHLSAIPFFYLLLLALGLATGCGKSKHAAAFPPWPRARYEAGGSNALLYFVLYGKFTPGAEVPARAYRTAGLPASIDLQYLTRADAKEFPFTNELFAQTVGKKNPELFQQVRTAPECLILRGEVADPHDLNYLRDVVGLIMFSLDHGGIAVLDVQQLKLFDPATWRNEIFQPLPPQLAKHITILVSDEPNGSLWLHTRGMRKFGRPDISWHNVNPTNQIPAVDMFNRLILLQATGALVPENQPIKMESLPPGLTVHHTGNLDDPDFNNVHLEITPASK